jgi:hypothetical protein
MTEMDLEFEFAFRPPRASARANMIAYKAHAVAHVNFPYRKYPALCRDQAMTTFTHFFLTPNTKILPYRRGRKSSKPASAVYWSS